MAIVPIVVLAGQSNAALAGVDNRLFEQLAASGNAFELVKVAEGGTSLFANAAKDWDPASGELFSTLVASVQQAIAHVVSQGHTPVVTTLWIQGEADRVEPEASLYDEHLLAFIDQYRAAIGIADAPFHISLLQSGTVRDAQIAAASARDNVHLIETLGLTFWDGVHYDRPGRIAIAERFFAQAGVVSGIDETYANLRAPVGIVDLPDGRHEITAPYFEDFIYTHGADTGVRIFSFSGDDEIRTGAGNDFINAGGNDDWVWAGGGSDRVQGGVHDDHLYGEDGNDSLTGVEGIDHLEGGAGNDGLNGGAGADTMIGGTGDDIYTMEHSGDEVIEFEGEGMDEVRTVFLNYTLGDHLERLVGIRPGAGQGLTGNALDNHIAGGAFDDVIDGGLGVDQMAGGAGNDSYVLDHEGDRVFEAEGGGIDHVSTSAAMHFLSSWVENLTGTAGQAQMLAGNDLANAIVSGRGSDVLNGGAGSDYLTGGKGHDIYILDTADETVIELVGEGVDEVRTSAASYVLAAEVERLTGLSDLGQQLTGNGLDNAIEAGEGADVLDGGGGGDVMQGYGGNDTYVVDSAGDVVNEASDGGIDGVRTTIAAYRLAENLENLTGLSAEGQSLAGNASANVIAGVDGNDIIEGGAADDILNGGAGIDTTSYAAAEAAVLVRLRLTGSQDTKGAGFDTLSGFENLVGSVHDDSLTGDFADNRIDGGEGADLLTGLNGIDWMFGEGGQDTVNGGIGADILAGGADDDRLIGESGADLLEGGAGNDHLDGGTARDTVHGGDGDDVVLGGRQTDILTGGAGADRFVFADFDTSARAALADRITDFEAGDLIDLSAMQADGADAFAFIGQAAFSAAGVGEVRYRYAMGNTYLEGDGDGDGWVDFTIRLDGPVSLTEASFLL